MDDDFSESIEFELPNGGLDAFDESGDGSLGVVIHTIEYDPGKEGSPYVSPETQLLNFMRADLGRGAEFIDMGRSTPGTNLNLTDEERAEWLDSVEPSILRVRDRILAGQPLLGSEASDAPSSVPSITTEVSDQNSFEPEDQTEILARRLTPAERSVFELVVLAGFSVDAVAGVLGITRPAVRERLSRVRSHLAEVSNEDDASS